MNTKGRDNREEISMRSAINKRAQAVAEPFCFQPMNENLRLRAEAVIREDFSRWQTHNGISADINLLTVRLEYGRGTIHVDTQAYVRDVISRNLIRGIEERASWQAPSFEGARFTVKFESIARTFLIYDRVARQSALEAGHQDFSTTEYPDSCVTKIPLGWYEEHAVKYSAPMIATLDMAKSTHDSVGFSDQMDMEILAMIEEFDPGYADRVDFRSPDIREIDAVLDGLDVESEREEK